MTYAKQLKQMMAEQNINQKRLSELTGIGKSSISQYVNGSNEPSQSNREKIKNVLGAFQQIDEVIEEVTTNVPISVAAKKLGKIRTICSSRITTWGFLILAMRYKLVPNSLIIFHRRNLRNMWGNKKYHRGNGGIEYVY